MRADPANVRVAEPSAPFGAGEASAIVNGDWMIGDDELGGRFGSISYQPDAVRPSGAVDVLNPLK